MNKVYQLPFQSVKQQRKNTLQFRTKNSTLFVIGLLNNAPIQYNICLLNNNKICKFCCIVTVLLMSV